MAETLGIYIHIPFCASKCDYCDFYSLPGHEGWKERYAAALCTHMKEYAYQARRSPVDTVYIGGGTPLMLGEKALLGVLSAVKKDFYLTHTTEITVEANPDSVDGKTLKRLRRAGVNRLSLGMQSAVDRELAAVHRPHTFAQTKEAVAWARKAGIKNLSLDLIYGLPGQTLESWEESLRAALALEPEHLSCYGLKVEEGTPLARRVAEGEVLPDDDTQADCYLRAVELLTAAGYEHYEISNFAKPGFASRHNMRYWTLQPYLGFGPGAHSDFGECRFSIRRDLEGYISAMETGSGPLLDENTPIPAAERCSEYLMLRLRTAEGVEEWEYRRRYFMNFDPVEALLLDYAAQGWAERAGERWRLTAEGFLRSNQLIGAILEAQEKATLNSTLRSVQKLGRGTTV